MRTARGQFAGVLLLAVALAACAEEGGKGHYSPGTFASFVDLLPREQPSLGLFNYFAYYQGSAQANGPLLPMGGRIASHLDATTYGDAPGVFWVTPLDLLGGHYAPGVALPFVWTQVKAELTLPGGSKVSRSESVSGLGDLEFWPVALSWTAWGTNLHVNFFGGIFAPTGEYQANRLANQGLGYWTFEPGVLISYLDLKSGIEVSTFVGYDLNTRNSTTDYQSGQQFHIDATLAEHLPLGKGYIGAGVSGFYLQQTTGDSGSGARLGGLEEMTAGVGPVLSYGVRLGKTVLATELKWLPQIGARNTLKGDLVWFKVEVQF